MEPLDIPRMWRFEEMDISGKHLPRKNQLSKVYPTKL